MGFEVIRTVEELKGRRDVMEIAPGKFNDIYFSDSSIFIDEDDFVYAEPSIKRYYSKYDHYEMNNVPCHIGRKIVDQWFQNSNLLEDKKNVAAYEILDLHYMSNRFEQERIDRERHHISKMLQELAFFVEQIFNKNEFFCILGV